MIDNINSYSKERLSPHVMEEIQPYQASYFNDGTVDFVNTCMNPLKGKHIL